MRLLGCRGRPRAPPVCLAAYHPPPPASSCLTNHCSFACPCPDAQFNRQLDILEDFVTMRGYKYSRLDGTTNRVQVRCV